MATTTTTKAAFFQDWDNPETGFYKSIDVAGPDGPTVQDKTVTIRYKGTLVGEEWWTAQDVADCWLAELQGMEPYREAILSNNVDASVLLNNNDGSTTTDVVLDEDYCANQLGVDNKIRCKKLVMAAKKLRQVRTDFPIGTVFDENESYTVEPAKRIVQGLRMGIDSMVVGETARFVCRSDLAYGSEGLRRNNGDVMVPPFATLCFEVSLLAVED